MSLAEDLRAAKALIDTPDKWAQNPRGTNPPCAYGALSIAILGADFMGKRRDEVDDDRWSRAERALKAQLPERSRGIASFNDDPTTTHPDIMALFDRAIAAAESKP